MFKKLTIGVAAFAVLAIPGLASAHVVVKPAEATVGSYETFTMGVPNERDNLVVTSVRLIMPSGLNYVQPTVKPGWEIAINKEGEAVKEITWSNGSIPVGQRDSFTFAAQVPASATSVQWKAYQTYSDGSVDAWDQAPSSNKDDESVKPYSVTKVVNDLETENAATTSSDSSSMLSLAIAIAALIVSVGGLLLRNKRT